jgi:tyrosinase
MAGSMVYRLRADAPDAPHLVTFRDALARAKAIRDNRGYDFIAGFHGAPGYYCWHHQENPRTQLQARLFLPWHRAYLWHLEQALQDLVDGVALPWWDWTRDRRIPAAYDAPQLDGAANPLYSTHVTLPQTDPPIDRDTTRDPGGNPQALLPTARQIDALLEESDWATFNDDLEQLHDEVHVWVGGDMSDVITAAYDPIFFAHHGMIDRVWSLWQVRHGNGGIPDELLPLPLQPFGKTFRDVLDVQALGYEYAASAAEVPLTPAGARSGG